MVKYWVMMNGDLGKPDIIISKHKTEAAAYRKLVDICRYARNHVYVWMRWENGG